MIQSETARFMAGATAGAEVADGTRQPLSIMLSYRPAPDKAAAFNAELSRALASVREATGCRATVVLGPPPDTAGEIRVIIQFDGMDSARRWRESTGWRCRADVLTGLGGPPALRESLGPEPCFDLPAVPTAAVPTAAGPLAAGRGAPPPRAKMAVVMWISVYPTITALLWLLWPLVQGLALPLRTLVLSVVMVPLMVWVIVPRVTALLAPWLGKTKG